MWWMHLFEEASDTLQVDDFMRCLLTRFFHVINRHPAMGSGPLQILRANALLEQFVLPILDDLPQPVLLLWFASAARPTQEGPTEFKPFSNGSIVGQTGLMLKRVTNPDEDSDVPLWPVFHAAGKKGHLPAAFNRRFCRPLILRVAKGECPQAELEALCDAIVDKKGKSDAAVAVSTRTEALVVRRLQQFHVTLGMLWSMAYGGNDPRDFDFTVTTLETLLLGALLNGLELPTHLARDVITYLVPDLRTQP
jgi:hypothetical protein